MNLTPWKQTLGATIDTALFHVFLHSTRMPTMDAPVDKRNKSHVAEPMHCPCGKQRLSMEPQRTLLTRMLHSTCTDANALDPKRLEDRVARSMNKNAHIVDMQITSDEHTLHRTQRTTRHLLDKIQCRLVPPRHGWNTKVCTQRENLQTERRNLQYLHTTLKITSNIRTRIAGHPHLR